MVARQGHREFVPLVIGKSVSECRNVVVLVVAVVNAKLILQTFALDLKKSAIQNQNHENLHNNPFLGKVGAGNIIAWNSFRNFKIKNTEKEKKNLIFSCYTLFITWV